MMKKEMILLALLAIGFTSNSLLGVEKIDACEKAKMFDKDVTDELNDADYRNFVLEQGPDGTSFIKIGQHEYEKLLSRNGLGETLFVKLGDAGNYRHRFRIKDLIVPTTDPIIKKRIKNCEFHMDQGNACKCYGLIKDLDKDGELQPIDVVIYGKYVQDVSHCELFKQTYEEQLKLMNQEKGKSTEEVQL